MRPLCQVVRSTIWLSRMGMGLLALVVYALAVRPATAQDAPAVAALLLERMQPASITLIYAADAAQAEALRTALRTQQPTADIRLYGQDALLPAAAPWLYLVDLGWGLPAPAALGQRYQLMEHLSGVDGDLWLYRRLPGVLQRLAQFGDAVELIGWQITRPALVQPCAVIRLESWWRITAPVPQDYSMAFGLSRLNGERILSVDGAPAGSQMRLWQPGQVWVDERELTIPCDLAPGEYVLVVGVYDWANGQSLPVFPDGWLRARLMALVIAPPDA